MKVSILDLIIGTTVDGPGFRTSIYFAGCRHECPGCHNPQSWDFNGGRETDIDDIMKIVIEEDFDVTLTGGDPMYQPEIVKELSRRVKEAGHSVWVYTGFTWEEIQNDRRLMDALEYVEAIVDGPFIMSLRDTDLKFRGSSNQKIVFL